MLRLMRLSGLVLLTTAPLWATPARAAPKIAVFDLEFIDSTGADPTEADKTRTAELSSQLRALLEKSGQYQVVSIAPARAALDKAPDIHGCNGCERDFAKQLGASLAVVGLVRRAGEHLFSITVVVENVATGKPLKQGTADVRGDDEASWYRGLKFLLDDRILE